MRKKKITLRLCEEDLDFILNAVALYIDFGRFLAEQVEKSPSDEKECSE